MTTSKCYIIVMSACCFLALGNKPSCASTIDDAIAKVPQEYLSSKNYADITDNTLKREVREICYSTCNRMECKEKERKKKCKKLCPKEDIKNCLSYTPIDKAIAGVPKKYLLSKNYADITDNTLKRKVQKICRSTCNKVSCQAQEMKDKCKKLCPEEAIKSCLSIQVIPGFG